MTADPTVRCSSGPDRPEARPVAVRVRDVRSVWGPPLDVPLGALVTVLVGPNRAGTSNVAWAIAAALDPTRRFRPGRDHPRGRDGSPEVRVTLDTGHRAEVAWDPLTGARSTSGPLPEGHVVLSRIHETPRDVVRRAPLDLDDPDARAALGADVRELAAAVLPELAEVEVPADLAVSLRDDLGSLVPVPEARAMVALGVAHHLAARGRPPAAVVVETPDAFLHPAGQEAVADLLVELAATTGAPVVITTASPFAIPRVAEATVVSLARDAAGRTGLVGSARGDATQARLLGGLLRDAGLAAVLDRVGRVPPETRGVLIVEGGTDEAYLRTVAAVLDREDVLADVVISPSGGAMGAALSAIVLRAETDVPLLVLLDHDDAGRRARDTLVSRFGFDRSGEVVTYADVFDGHPPGVEAETLFDPGLLRWFVRERGASASHGERDLHGLPHIDLTSSGKAAFVSWLDDHARPEHLLRWHDVLDLLSARLAGVGRGRGPARNGGPDLPAPVG